MDIFLDQDLSVYQQALGAHVRLQPFSVSSANLLSLVRAQIDLLIEQNIAATLWVKLPPGKIWHTEIQRYSQQLNGSCIIFDFHVAEAGNRQQKVEAENAPSSPFTSSFHHVYLFPDSLLRREYFFLVLSSQLCSLISVSRPQKKRQPISGKPSHKTSSLLAINTFDGRLIQQVLDSFKKTIPLESPLRLAVDLVCPVAPEPTLISQLLANQLQQQERITRQIVSKQISKTQQQHQKLQNKLQLKDEFLRNVCQELRTPITHMKTALSLLNSPNLKVPQRQRYLQLLNTQCEYQNSLITGVLTLVEFEHNLEQTPLESVRLSDVVPGVVSTYQPLAQEKGIMLAYTVPTQLPPVWCVSGGIKQIVIHLLSNSIKFTPNGGQVWVRCRVQGDYVQLEFRDTGIGIAESEIPKIFDPFYRVRPAAEESGGVGLGLTIVQQLLWRSGGSISLKSRTSEGSTFTINLASVRDHSSEKSTSKIDK